METDRTFTYDAAGKLLAATETEDNYGTCVYTFEYDLMGNRTYMEKTLNGTVVEWHRYEYNESNQLISEKLYNGKKTTSLAYTYDADGNRISENGRIGTDKVNKTYEYSVENRLAAVHDGDELLLAAAYDGDGNRVFLLNYNLHTDDDWKGNSGNGNGNNKDNSGSGNKGNGESGLLNNRAGQIFLDYGDIVMGPAVKTPADIIVIRETVKGNSDSKEMQRTATAGFYAGFVGQGIEYTQIISKADYQLSMIITSAKGVNSINNPLSYLLFIKDFSLTQTLDAAKAGLQDAWNGTYDSAIGRKIGAGTFNYLLMTIGGAQLKGKGNACEAVESGRDIVPDKGFSSFKDLKTHLDSPGDGKVWHHIVEQSQITGSGFSSEQVNNINNVIAIPHGKGSIHAKISGYYSSKQFFTGGKTVRQWLAGQDFKTQFDFGMNLLKEYGDVIPSSKGWIFRTFE